MLRNRDVVLAIVNASKLYVYLSHRMNIYKTYRNGKTHFKI